MAEATRAGQEAKEMVDYGIEVLGIREARWKGMGLVTLPSVRMWHSQEMVRCT